MEIPSKVKILALEWEVKRSKDIGHAAGAYGTTVHATQTINVEPDLTPAHTEQTFLHEIMHACFISMGLHKMEGMNHDKEEIIVNSLSNCLLHVLKDNHINFDAN